MERQVCSKDSEIGPTSAGASAIALTIAAGVAGLLLRRRRLSAVITGGGGGSVLHMPSDRFYRVQARFYGRHIKIHSWALDVHQCI